MATGSTKWQDWPWLKLFERALEIMDGHRPGGDWWSFGGGSALTVHYRHRLSRDVDIFLESARDLKALTPNANEFTRRVLGDRKYEYPGNYLKLHQDEGEIDFIIAAPVTTDPFRAWTFRTREVRIETPVEIALKKLFFRPSQFKLRDIFDLAIVQAHDGAALAHALPLVRDRIDKAIDRIEKLAAIYDRTIGEDVDPTDLGRPFMTAERAVGPVLDLLRKA